jgi:hypothetical protein
MSQNRRHVDSSDEDEDDDADWLRPSVRKAAQGGDIGSDDDDFAVSLLKPGRLQILMSGIPVQSKPCSASRRLR